MLLALDTATSLSGIALFDSGAVVAELNWTSRTRQTGELLPRLSQLLAWHAIDPAAIRAIAVSLGPGSFTGLRVALSLAKGMSVAHGTPLIGVPTLDATALPFVAAGMPVCAMVAAGRARFYWATYASTPAADGWEPATLGGWQGWRTATGHGDAEALAATIRVPTLFSGEIPLETGEILHTALGGRALLPAIAARGRRAVAVAELGWVRWRAGDSDDPASLAPIYLHEP